MVENARGNITEECLMIIKATQHSFAVDAHPTTISTPTSCMPTRASRFLRLTLCLWGSWQNASMISGILHSSQFQGTTAPTSSRTLRSVMNSHRQHSGVFFLGVCHLCPCVRSPLLFCPCHHNPPHSACHGIIDASYRSTQITRGATATHEAKFGRPFSLLFTVC